MLQNREIVELKVAADSNPSSVAGSIAKNIGERKRVELTAIGAGAINQMVKAVATASGYVAQNGVSLGTKVAWTNVNIGEEPRSAIKLILLEL